MIILSQTFSILIEIGCSFFEIKLLIILCFEFHFLNYHQLYLNKEIIKGKKDSFFLLLYKKNVVNFNRSLSCTLNTEYCSPWSKNHFPFSSSFSGYFDFFVCFFYRDGMCVCIYMYVGYAFVWVGFIILEHIYTLSHKRPLQTVKRQYICVKSIANANSWHNLCPLWIQSYVWVFIPSNHC